jgi:hypothetical protein
MDTNSRAGERRLRRAAGLAVAVMAALAALYAIAGFILLPRYVRQTLTNYVTHELKARLTLGSLAFNPFTLRADVRAFALNAADGAPLASFDRLQVRGSASSLWRGVTLAELQLDAPSFEIGVAHDGSLNWSRLIGAPALAAASPPSTSPTRPPTIRIAALRVRGGRIHFEDRSRESPFSTVLSPIEIELRDFRTVPQFHNALHFSARTQAGEGIDWSGEFSLHPFGSIGSVQLTALKATTIAGYLQDALPVGLPSGSLDLRVSYRWASGTPGTEALTLEQLTVHDLAIAPKVPADQPGAPWIALGQLQVSSAQVDLATHRIQVAEVLLHAPSVHAWRESDGSLNLERLAPPSAATTAADSPATAVAAPAPRAPAPPWLVSLQRLSLDEGTIDVEDRSVAPAAKLSVRAIKAQVQGYSSAADAQPVSFELAAQVGDHGALSTHGDWNASAREARVSLELQRLDLTALQPYVAQQTDIALYRGKLSTQAQLNYRGAPGGDQPQLELSGGLTIGDFATRERASNSELLNWQSLELAGVHYQRRPDALHIERVTLRRAFGRVLIGADGTLNLAQMLRPRGTAPAASTSSTAVSTAPVAAGATRNSTAAAVATPAASAAVTQPMPIRIDHVDVSGSSADFTDRSVQPTFSAVILSLRGSVAGLSSQPGTRAQVTLSGQLDQYAPVSITGQVNLLSASAFTDLSMNFSNIDLTIFNPYSGKFAGYSIAQGKLATQMHYHVEDRRLEASHHIVIDQLEFGAATENKPAVPLPVKLAAALLKDRKGVISIDLPVGGSLDDPTFRIGPIIWKVFVNLVTKIVTAPFALLGSLFGGGEQLAYVDFAAGSSAIPDASQQKITQLAKALTERPQLKLDVPLHTVSLADDQALAHAALEQAVTAAQAAAAAASAAPASSSRSSRGSRARRPVVAEPVVASPRLLALETLYRQQFHSEPSYPSDTDTSNDTAVNTAAADTAAPRAVAVSAGDSKTAAPSAPPAGAAQAVSEAHIAWLERQLLPKYAPTGADRNALGRARADAIVAAIVAGGQLSPERVFLTDRPSGGGPAGMSRMELQLQ